MDLRWSMQCFAFDAIAAISVSLISLLQIPRLQSKSKNVRRVTFEKYRWRSDSASSTP